MFVQAGFRDDYRVTRIKAMVYVPPSNAQLWRWQMCASFDVAKRSVLIQWRDGERAWAGRGGVSWPHRIKFHNFISGNWERSYAGSAWPREH